MKYSTMTIDDRSSAKVHRKCRICDRSTNPFYLVIDHCHIHDEFRGVICCWCNVVLETVCNNKTVTAQEALDSFRRYIKWKNEDGLPDPVLRDTPDDWPPSKDRMMAYINSTCSGCKSDPYPIQAKCSRKGCTKYVSGKCLIKSCETHCKRHKICHERPLTPSEIHRRQCRYHSSCQNESHRNVA